MCFLNTVRLFEYLLGKNPDTHNILFVYLTSLGQKSVAEVRNIWAKSRRNCQQASRVASGPKGGHQMWLINHKDRWGVEDGLKESDQSPYVL